MHRAGVVEPGSSLLIAWRRVGEVEEKYVACRGFSIGLSISCVCCGAGLFAWRSEVIKVVTLRSGQRQPTAPTPSMQREQLLAPADDGARNAGRCALAKGDLVGVE